MHPNDAARIAEQFRGWMTTEELRWLARTAAQHERILEIGTYAGRSTAAMALMCKGEILSIDTLVGELGTPELHGHALFDLAHRNLASLDGACKVEQRRQSSGGLYMDWKYGHVAPFDMCWIDGAHDLSEVLFDVWACKQMVKPGGLLCGHDWNLNGVTPALALELPEARPVAGSIWAWEVPV